MGNQKKQIPPGDDLLSQRCVPPVPSALTGLTSGFGMGPGVSPPLKSPEESVFILKADYLLNRRLALSGRQLVD